MTPTPEDALIRIEGDVAIVSLTMGYEAIIDVSDIPVVSGRRWTAMVRPHAVYAISKAKRSAGESKMLYMHRVIIGAQDGTQIDHVDRCGLNNRKANLRIATASQNQHNQGVRKNNTTGAKGVSFDKRSGKWYARIKLNGQRFNLGTFVSLEEARGAYAAAAEKMHGDFGRVS
jgi:hypothetical protein